MNGTHLLTPVGVRPPLGRYLAETWQRRHFLTELVKARVSAANSATVLGAAWLLLTPLLNASLYFLVFGVLLGAQSSVPQYPLFLLSGVLMFTFVSRALTAQGSVLRSQRDLVRTLPFPRLLLPLASLGVESTYLVWSLLVMFTVAAFTAGVHATWLAALAGVVLLVVMVSGCGLMVARAAGTLPDLVGLLPFGLRAAAYLSGVYFPLSAVSSVLPTFATALSYLPLAANLTVIRDGLLGQVSPWPAWAVAGGTAAAALLAGLVVFWRGEPGYGRD